MEGGNEDGIGDVGAENSDDPDAGMNTSIIVRFPHGTLTWYKAKNEFVAVCQHGHGQEDGNCEDCRKHRSGNAGSRKAQGRACGFLAAWLLAAADYPDANWHRTKFVLTRDDRVHAREYIKGLPNGHQLLKKERDIRDGEAEEPTKEP